MGAGRLELAPFRSKEEFWDNAEFTAPHDPSEKSSKFGVRLWRNLNHFQSNYILIFFVAVTLNVLLNPVGVFLRCAVIAAIVCGCYLFLLRDVGGDDSSS